MSDQAWKDDVLDTPSSRCVNLTTLYPKKGVALKDFEQNWFLFSLLCTCLMCFNGGFVNAICFAGPWHAGLTHVTGSVTLSGTRVAVAAKPGQYAYWEYLSFVFSFGFGGAFAGFVIGDPWRRWGRVQASLCICQGLLLILAEYVYTQNVSLTLSAIIISFAMGIQNTISSMYAPMTIRTSHVSGTVLDIGMTVGSMIRTRSLDNLWKIKVHAPSLFSYWLGAVIGCFTYVAWAEKALYVNATATIAFGVLTFIMFRTPVCYFEDPALVALNLEQQQKEEQGLFSPSVLSPLSPRYQSGYGSVPEPLIDYTRDDVVEKIRFDKY